jgi:hypothetical protein
MLLLNYKGGYIGPFIEVRNFLSLFGGPFCPFKAWRKGFYDLFQDKPSCLACKFKWNWMAYLGSHVVIPWLGIDILSMIWR